MAQALSDRRGAAALYLTASELCERWGISKPTLYRHRQQGYVPEPIRLGPRSVRWRIEEIEAFERRIAADRGTP